VSRELPADKDVHVVLDNYATHKHPKVTSCLARHQRFTFHFTPTSCSWANAVEGLFAKLTRHSLKRGVFTSIVELQAAINRFIAETNEMPKPFVWTKSADAILAAVQREASVRSDPLVRAAGPSDGTCAFELSTMHDASRRWIESVAAGGAWRSDCPTTPDRRPATPASR
jgi:transposase